MTSGRPNRYATLDAWRAVACLSVVVFHATYYARVRPPGEGLAAWLIGATARGWMGVPLFFVISGYCIAAAASTTPAGREGDYFVRRLRRIFPPYLLVLGGTLALVLLTVPAFFTDDPNGIAPPASLGPWQWLGNVTLTEGWRRHFTPEAGQYFLGHAWTLGYEEQFYAVMGLLLFLPRRFFFPGAAAVTVLTAALFAAKRFGVEPVSVDGFFLDGRWLLFAAGILVFHRAKWAPLPLLLAAAVAAHAPWKLALVKANFWQELFVASLFALVLLALHRFDGRSATTPALKPLMWTGKLTYSLYLLHLPVTKTVSHLAEHLGLTSDAAVLAVVVPLSVAGSIVVAWPFHVFVERRFMPTR